jgi:hypothetical protein
MEGDMPDAKPKVTDLPSGMPDEGTQLAVLLDAARELVSQEIERGERLDGKSRNQFAAVGALFAVVMATTAAVLNDLVANSGHPHQWVYISVGILSAIAVVTIGAAFAISVRSWHTRQVDTLDSETLRAYIPFAEKGNPAIVKNLINVYADILDDRRRQNSERSDAFKLATKVCTWAAVASLLQLLLVFATVATQ